MSATKKAPKKKPTLAASPKVQKTSLAPWVITLIAITVICFLPIIQHDFTNWDDEFYVLRNAMVKSFDLKAMFTEQVLGNYHPVTMITLAINWLWSGSAAWSYLVTNLFLHTANTILVFYFIYRISGTKIWPAFFTALVFAIHPMHVESVAWVAERKDVLYTFFFISSLIMYWSFIQTGQKKYYAYCISLFIISLLSKPAAIMLPFVLLLLDYWKGRKWTTPVILEKIPFFLLSLAMGIVTLQIQRAQAATLDLNTYSITTRFFFATYTLMTYFFRFFIPYPLATLHPYPPANNLGAAIYAAPIFVLTGLVILWFNRKNKWVVFGVLFFIINLLLVLQIISIGSSLVSERYTYVPYIGLAFALSGWLASRTPGKERAVLLPLSVVAVLIFGAITINQTGVWKNSGELWSNVLNYYPENELARGNRASYLSKLALEPAWADRKDSIYRQAFEDCRIALESKPNYIPAYQTRAVMFLDQKRYQEALDDANHLARLAPNKYFTYEIRGSALSYLGQYAAALDDFNKLMTLSNTSHKGYNNRATILMNQYKRYPEALEDLNKAIAISPQGNYYLNRSICYYKMNNLAKAKEDAVTAMQKGTSLSPNYRSILGL